MKNYLIIFCLFILGFSNFAYAENWFSGLLNSDAEEQQNTGVEGKTFKVKKISIELKNINDFGFVFVIDESDTPNLAGSSEQTIGLTGSETIELAPYLKSGRNLLVFALWNKEGKTIDAKFYKKTFLDGWSFDYTLIGDGTNLYHLYDKKAGAVGVAY